MYYVLCVSEDTVIICIMNTITQGIERDMYCYGPSGVCALPWCVVEELPGKRSGHYFGVFLYTHNFPCMKRYYLTVNVNA